MKPTKIAASGHGPVPHLMTETELRQWAQDPATLFFLRRSWTATDLLVVEDELARTTWGI